MRILAVVTDAFGGHGGIAQFNRDFLTALAGAPSVSQVVVLPRCGRPADGRLPDRIRQLAPAAGRLAYAARALRVAISQGTFDLIVCGHISMAPVATPLAKLLGVPVWIHIHGIDAWMRPTAMQQRAVEGAAHVTAVSRYTRRRFLNWGNVPPSRVSVLPNTVAPRYVPGSKPANLIARYGLDGKQVLLTVSRLAAAERYKGHDRIIAALPRVLAVNRDVVYLVVGDGDDRARLERLAIEHGVSSAVRFLGRVASEDLGDHYRLADLFVMPSTGEGFGIVFLEATASGVPVIAGNRDGSADALADGAVGRLVDPDDRAGLTDAILGLLEDPGLSGYGLSAKVHTRFGPDPFGRHVRALAASVANL